jgi:hypothetical protein
MDHRRELLESLTTVSQREAVRTVCYCLDHMLRQLTRGERRTQEIFAQYLKDIQAYYLVPKKNLYLICDEALLALTRATDNILTRSYLQEIASPLCVVASERSDKPAETLDSILDKATKALVVSGPQQTIIYNPEEALAQAGPEQAVKGQSEYDWQVTHLEHLAAVLGCGPGESARLRCSLLAS